MASHLTIISGTNAGANARPFNGAKSDADTNAAPGLFAALLDTKPAETKAASGMGETGESELARLVRLGLATASGEKGEETADAIAAALDLKGLDALPVDPAPMVDFVEALRALKSSLDNGEPLDPDLLAKADAALTRLAEALGLDLETLPVPLDFAALLDAEGASGTGLGAALNEMLSPLAQSLAAAQAPESARAIAGEASAKDQLKALGDKLAALLGALEDGAVGEDKLAAIGMKPGAAPADEITLAMARFAAGADAEAQVPEEPVLAAPSLKVKETSLTGEAAKPASSGEPVRADNASTRDDTGSDMPRRDPRPAPATAPAPQAPADAAASPAAQAAAQAPQDPAAIRMEASGLRVVQSGYQTSQQQLNLPQIAFELSRQIQDGNSRFQIRLDPPELGKIDVRLDIDKGGQVHARLTVEKSETLDLMQRDQRALERALQQAGLDGAKTSLEFSLKQNPFAGQDRQDRHGGLNFGGEDASTAEIEEAPPTITLYRGGLQASGVNIIA